MIRSTMVVDGPLALRMQRLTAARQGVIGREILTLPPMAARLAGGFAAAAGSDVLYPIIQAALAEGDFRALGAVSSRPGMPRAVLRTLEAAWRADIDLAALPANVERFGDLLAIEARIRTLLPPARMLLRDLRDAALARVELATVLLGPVTLSGVVDVDPVWRPLLIRLAEQTNVTWDGPAGPAPAWFTGVYKARPAALPATTRAEVAADPRSEVVEALRWVRELLSSGKVKAMDVGIAATSPNTWDDHMVALSRSAGLPLHFSHGVPALSTSDGQACAALADILINGLSQQRVRRLVPRLLTTPFGARLPADWSAGLPREAALKTLEHWQHALRRARDQRDNGDAAEHVLVPVLEVIARGPEAAVEAGGRLLSGSALSMWDEALKTAPPQAVALSLGELRVADGRDPGNSVVWCPASQLAASPRPWTRLLGLTSRNWPRSGDDDPLVPDHLLSRHTLHPSSISERDRAHFEIIRTSTRDELVLSRPQRSATGGLLSASALWPGGEVVRKRDRIPAHAFSESDRLLARPADAGKLDRVIKSKRCWHNWHHDPSLTGTDGLVSINHPAIEAALARVQSSTSLQRLLCDPLGFVWRYALGWRAIQIEPEPFQLDARTFGELVHALIGGAIGRLEPVPGFARANDVEIASAIDASAAEILSAWPLERSVPPPLLWTNTVAEAARRTASGLAADIPTQPDTRSWTEVPFGQKTAPVSEGAPWDSTCTVPIGDTGLNFGGRIDRLDIRASGDAARITDYKSGRPPDRAQRVMLAQGRELQRVLYAMALTALLPDVKTIQARLVYLADEPAILVLKGEELEVALRDAMDYLAAAIAILRGGRIAPRWENDASYDDMRIALPADREAYLRHKMSAFRNANRKLDRLWRAAT
jgi:hypothetical protein